MVTTPHRTFPDPDPLFRFIDPEDGPYMFWRLPNQLRSLCLRFYLVALCAGYVEMVAWHVTFAPDVDEADLWRIVDQWPDDRLERAIADASRRKAAGMDIEYPFTG